MFEILKPIKKVFPVVFKKPKIMNVIEFNSSVTEFQIIDKIIDSGKCIENVFSVILQILTKREHINCFIVSQQITTLTYFDRLYNVRVNMYLLHFLCHNC